MKRKILFAAMAIAIAVLASAQGADTGRNQRAMPSPEKITVSGSLVITRGMPSIVSGGETYIIGGINRLAGFVDGLKEGAQITVEGLTPPRNKEGSIKFLFASKLTVSGKAYDLAPPEGSNGQGNQWWGGQVPPHNSMRFHGPFMHPRMQHGNPNMKNGSPERKHAPDKQQ